MSQLALSLLVGRPAPGTCPSSKTQVLRQDIAILPLEQVGTGLPSVKP